MPDLRAQLQAHDGYVDMPVLGYAVWWRDDEGVKTSGRMPLQEVDLVVRHLNDSYHPVTFWRTPVYHWHCLVESASGCEPQA